jgi:GDPmannose 4,6-dehydratase
MHATNGILFNHESPRRGENFVTRKITLGVGAILRGERTQIALGNLDARRDWGFARDYMDGAWQMLQQDAPDDYVLATNETHSVQDFLQEAFDYAGLDWREHVTTDERFLRPAEVDVLIGDYSKAKAKLGWEPNVHFRELVRMMVDADR